MDNFIGMNYYAAKELGFPFPYGPNVLILLKGLERKRQRRVLRHEKVEIALMKKGYRYKEADAAAKILEKSQV